MLSSVGYLDSPNYVQQPFTFHGLGKYSLEVRKKVGVSVRSQEGYERLKSVRAELSVFVKKLTNFGCTENVLHELMVRRNYTTQKMYDTLKELGIFKFDYISELKMVDPTVTDEQLKLWGVMTESGEYILKGRYVVPIRDIAGKVTALVGWYPDVKKYVTTPTYGFIRDAQFFNIECYKHSITACNGVVYLVEGIFDAISLRSLGLPALGNMGLEMSPLKTQMLLRFKKVIAIPDTDNSGKGVCPYTARVSGKKKKFVWDIENDHVFVSLPKGVKDVDDFIKEFDCYDDLVSCQSSKLIKKLKIEA